MCRTGIMATIADSRCSRSFVSELMNKGMKAVRINSAHVNPQRFCEMVRTIKSVSTDIKILMDTKGAEMRTTAIECRDIHIARNERITIRSSSGPSRKGNINVNVPDLYRFVNIGNNILIDDGAIELEITDINDNDIIAACRKEGVINSRKTINIPGLDIPTLPAISNTDRIMIEAAADMHIDMIAHSFVRNSNDAEAVRSMIGDSGITLYSKIECRSGITNMTEILDSSDGLLVARGDLGAQIPIEQVPAVQYDAVKACKKAKKSVIVATQLLQSMIQSPIPTRAEISDISLAVMEGVDMLLLCGETAQGAYPAECVDIMQRTIIETEKRLPKWTMQ